MTFAETTELKTGSVRRYRPPPPPPPQPFHAHPLHVPNRQAA